MAKLIDLNGLAHVYSIIKGMLADKLGKNDTAVNASKVNNLTVETAVPKNAKFTDTVYAHPATHPASMITGLASVATSGSYSDLSNKPTIPVVPTKVSAFMNDAGYLTQHQSLDDYAKKTDISGFVKTVNGTAPDTAGNVTINVSGGGGVSTSESNTWTGKQTFQKMKFNFESYNAPRISGTIDNPSSSVAVYNVQGNFTLDMSVLAGLLRNSDATLFTAYITADADYTLTITNAGTIKYIGNASDVAITSAGLLLNIMMLKDARGNVTSIVQASKLS